MSVPSLSEVLHADAEAWADRGLERRLLPIRRAPGAVLHTPDVQLVDFSANDYLGLATDDRLTRAVREFLEHGTLGAGASRLIAGTHPEHEALERELAEFFGAEAALSFSSGYSANAGAIPSLVGPRDVVFADALNHASLIDGCRLSRAVVHVYPHADMTALRELLATYRTTGRRAMIVSDGLFSMDGDSAPLADIVELARAHDAWTYIDDAHAVGAAGPAGRGSAERQGLLGEVDVTVGTLGKAFGLAGAFVYGPGPLRRHLLNRARSFVFSTAYPPALAAAARESLRIVRTEPARRVRLHENVSAVREALLRAGVHVGGETDSHIVPIFVGDATRTASIGGALRTLRVLVGAVRPPTVAHGTARLRVSVSAVHTHEHIDLLARGIAAAMRSA